MIGPPHAPACLIIARRWKASYGKIESMAKRKKGRRFSAVGAVKEMARERIGAPPASRVVPDRKKKKNEKHKPTMARLLDEAGS
jgi:hypothetical protein